MRVMQILRHAAADLKLRTLLPTSHVVGRAAVALAAGKQPNIVSFEAAAHRRPGAAGKTVGGGHKKGAEAAQRRTESRSHLCADREAKLRKQVEVANA